MSSEAALASPASIAFSIRVTSFISFEDTWLVWHSQERQHISRVQFVQF
jgi:hypothetical protein